MRDLLRVNTRKFPYFLKCPSTVVTVEDPGWSQRTSTNGDFVCARDSQNDLSEDFRP